MTDEGSQPVLRQRCRICRSFCTLRAAADVVIHTVVPYTALQQMINDFGPFGRHYYSKGFFLDDLSDAAIDVLAE